MPRATRILWLICFFAIAVVPLQAQIPTGAPPFGSFGGGPDIIDLANLNSHITIPVIHRAGRGTNFNYALTYDSSVWYPVTSGSTTSWQPVGNWGWSGQTDSATGFLGYKVTSIIYKSGIYNCTDWTYSHFVYHDEFGVPHPFSGQATDETGNQNACGGGQTILNSTASDGSGYKLHASGVGTAVAAYSTSKTGKVTYAPRFAGYGASTRTDRNGNQLTVDGSGNFYDTLNATVPVLKATGLGTIASPVILTYTAPSGSSVHYQANYTNYTVATNFSISGITDYKSSAAVPLITSITLPDGSQYTFTYEATPSIPSSGACSPYSGTTCVTARIAFVTLPTGGTITYTYTGGNNGVFSDGSTAGLTRVLSDGATWSATWGTHEQVAQEPLALPQSQTPLTTYR